MSATVTRMPNLGLPDRIRRARLAANYKTHAALADAIGRSTAVVSKWERGASDPKFCDVVLIARATDVPVEFFVEGVDAELPPRDPGPAPVKNRRRRAVVSQSEHSPWHFQQAA